MASGAIGEGSSGALPAGTEGSAAAGGWMLVVASGSIETVGAAETSVPTATDDSGAPPVSATAIVVVTATGTGVRESSDVSSTWAFTIAATELAASTPAIDRSVAVRVFTRATLGIGRPPPVPGTSKKRPRLGRDWVETGARLVQDAAATSVAAAVTGRMQP